MFAAGGALVLTKEKKIFFLHLAVSHIFHSPGFSGSKFSWVQVFQGLGAGSGSNILEVAFFSNIVVYITKLSCTCYLYKQ